MRNQVLLSELSEHALKLRLAEICQESDDPDTQTACMVFDKTGKIIAKAANQIPDNVLKNPDRLVRPAKYTWIQHAEQRALSNVAGGSQIAFLGTIVLNWFPCATCAQMIVQSGISVMYADQAAYEARKDDPRYGFAESMAMLTEAGIDIVWM